MCREAQCQNQIAPTVRRATTIARLALVPEQPAPVEGGMLGSTCRLGSTPWVSAQRKIAVASTRSSSVSVDERRGERRVRGRRLLAVDEVELDDVAGAAGHDRVDPHAADVGLRHGQPAPALSGYEAARMFRQATVRVSSLAKWIAERDRERGPADPGEVVEEDPDGVKELTHVLVNLPEWSRSTSPKASRSAGSAPGRTRASTTPSPARGRETLRGRAPAAERHRRAAHGPRAADLARRRARPLAPDAGLRDRAS